MNVQLVNLLEKDFDSIRALATQDGADAELLVEAGESLNVSVNNGAVEKFQSSHSNVGGVRVVFDGVEGYCWTESLAETDLISAYREALSNAKFAARGRDIGAISEKERVQLFSPTIGAPVPSEDPTLFNGTVDSLSIDDKIELAKKLERETKAVDPRIASVPYNGYSESTGLVAIFNTKGVKAFQRSSAIHGYSYCLAKTDTASKMGGDSFFSRDAGRLEIESVAHEAARRALEKLSARSPGTGNYPVVIQNDAAAEFFSIFQNYFSAKAVSEKTSLFADDLGKFIASPLLTIVDDPTLEDGVGNRPFDCEGVPTQRTAVVEAGRLKTFLTNTTYARRLAMPHTASAVRSARGTVGVGFSNLVVSAGLDPIGALLAKHPRTILVTEFKGFHAGFREGSGEFSLQVEGELWENGKKVSALDNFVVSGSIRDLFRDIEMVSDRLCKKTSDSVAPDLLIRSLSIAGSGFARF